MEIRKFVFIIQVVFELIQFYFFFSWDLPCQILNNTLHICLLFFLFLSRSFLRRFLQTSYHFPVQNLTLTRRFIRFLWFFYCGYFKHHVFLELFECPVNRFALFIVHERGSRLILHEAHDRHERAPSEVVL